MTNPNMPARILHTKLDGPGLFLFEVAGQNHYQPAILQLLQNRFHESAALESTAQSAEHSVTAILRSEPSNPHDGNAIAVEISGLTRNRGQSPRDGSLPEVWLHWDAKTVRERGADALSRSRVDFLFLLPNDVRVVIEIDDKERYTNGDDACPKKYATMVNTDLLLKLDGFQVFRFGGFELKEESAFE